MELSDRFYLVTFSGIPDWEPGQTTHPCTRRYLFSSQPKASEFVRRRTSGSGWYTHPAYQKNSMMYRLKHNSHNSYYVVALTPDEVCDEANPA